MQKQKSQILSQCANIELPSYLKLDLNDCNLILKTMTIKDWLTKTKDETASLETFITRIEGFISDTGLNCAKFESAVDKGLSRIASELNESFIPDKNAEN